MATILSIEAVSKRFYIHQSRPVTLKESALRRITGRRMSGSAHWALRDVTFSVEQGQSLGIIGHNGAGKSTLLRLLCGLGRPTSGRIRCTGRISGLLDLGSGFHTDLTGRENIMTGGLLSGLTKREVLEQQDEIIAFAELEEFIDEPVRTYSSGMYLRLAFATAMHFDPTVLLIDEVLAVGDARFQQKCLDRLIKFRASGKTLILTSHIPEQIHSLCNEVLVLEEGRVVMQGAPDDAVRCYEDLMRQRTERRAAQVHVPSTPSQAIAEGNRQGTMEAMITAVGLYDDHGQAVKRFRRSDSLNVELEYRMNRQISDLILSLSIYNEFNVKCFESIIPSVSATFGAPEMQGCWRCHIPEMPLLEGRYYVDVGLYPTDWSFVYDYHWQMHPLDIVSDEPVEGEVSGVVSLRPIWSTPAAYSSHVEQNA